MKNIVTFYMSEAESRQSVPSATETDIDNSVRVIGVRVDIGADEYGHNDSCPYPLAKIGSLYYETIEAAYDSLESGETIYIKGVFYEKE